jgi:hypothetical protein
LAHPNIVDLESICCEVHTGSEDALPVLVLKKAEFGDLDVFLDYGRIEEDSFSVKVGLCVDIANAILALLESSMFLASWTVI